MYKYLQVSLVALLFGTIVGDFALLGDVGNTAVHSWFDTPPAWLDPHGRIVMVLSAFHHTGVVAPHQLPAPLTD